MTVLPGILKYRELDENYDTSSSFLELLYLLQLEHEPAAN